MRGIAAVAVTVAALIGASSSPASDPEQAGAVERGHEVPTMTRSDASFYTWQVLREKYRFHFDAAKRERIGPCESITRTRMKCMAGWHVHRAGYGNLKFRARVVVWYSVIDDELGWHFSYDARSRDLNCAGRGGRDCTHHFHSD
jgi:hypothetical protein